MNLTGQRFGKLTVIRQSPDKLYNEIAYICKCACGNETIARKSHLIQGLKKSCGCLRKKSPTNVLNLEGKRFGKLTVIERAGKTKNDNALWLCQCDCGNTAVAMGTSLRRGDTISCGCNKDKQIANAKKVIEEKTIDGVQVPKLTQKVRSDSSTGHKGIYKRKRGKREYYEVSIGIKGKRKYVGSYKTLNEAINARKEAEKEYYEPYIKALEEKENENK